MINHECPTDAIFLDISKFIKSKFYGILDHSVTHQHVIQTFEYDVMAWLCQTGNRNPLKDYKCSNLIRINFSYDEAQMSNRDYLFEKYSSVDSSCLTSILASIRPQHMLFRKYDYVC